ncbi:MAG: IreB family regulatory phosphoprotein [Clostridia bacterium]|nr:IreB family regulatory phosphoprotein [Clostridia bacterium]MBR2847018.1 IreB family regulatory phosphoprotein [Clostridia bacterium]MBR2878173.1 IreB family regulatory phosphoprotein [Clostridia bacterium]MBR2973115.1 IreB family regulatory phosphoprotein [Clostridia bacterium]MBR3576409.1 IreB family regulatory phosphoprotein [Clostridia bacterium]
MENMDNTILHSKNDKQNKVEFIMESVYGALKEKGYNPVSQIVGYIMSGDPSYITSHQGARALITKIERDELLEEFVKSYVEKF